MNSAGKIAAALLLIGTAGCNHKVQSAAPPPAPPKVYTPDQVGEGQLPQPPPPKPEDVKPAPTEVAKSPPKTQKPSRHKSNKPADAAPVQAAKETVPASSSTTQEALAGQPSETSPIGQLTSSSPSSSTLTHRQVQDLIASTENGLNGIKRTLTSDEQQTATEIRTFLIKAKKALDQDDLDGANTLAMKAKVLLNELNKG